MSDRRRHDATRVSLLAILLVSVFAAGPAEAGLRLRGTTFAVAGDPWRSETGPRVAIDSSGGFAVAWTASKDDTAQTTEVRARLFDSEAQPLALERTINTYTDDIQLAAGIAASASGRFLVAWSGTGPGGACGIFARFADATDAEPQFPLDGDCIGFGSFAATISDAGDGFVTAWFDGDGTVRGTLLDADGVARARFEQETGPDDFHNALAIDGFPDGSFVIAWNDVRWVDIPPDKGGEIGIVHGARFGADAVRTQTFTGDLPRPDPGGDGFLVDGTSLALGADARGNFTVAYSSYVPPYVSNVDDHVPGFNVGASFERFVRGRSRGSAFVAATPDSVSTADLAVSPGGNGVLSYIDHGFWIRAVDCRGKELGPAVKLADRPEDAIGGPATLAVDESGDGVAVWMRQTYRSGDVTRFTVLGRRFRLRGGCVLCGDVDANGRITAADALSALRCSVGSGGCDPKRSDADGSATLSAVDALRILVAAVSQQRGALHCKG